MNDPRVKCRYDAGALGVGVELAFLKDLQLFHERLKPGLGVTHDLVLNDAGEARGLMQIAAELMAQNGISGKVSFHICSHAAGGEALWSCKDDAQAQYMEVVV